MVTTLSATITQQKRKCVKLLQEDRKKCTAEGGRAARAIIGVIPY